MARCVLWTFDGFGRLLTRFHVSCKSLLRFTIARNRRIDESYITPGVLWMQRSGGKMNRTCGASIESSGFRGKENSGSTQHQTRKPAWNGFKAARAARLSPVTGF